MWIDKIAFAYRTIYTEIVDFWETEADEAFDIHEIVHSLHFRKNSHSLQIHKIIVYINVVGNSKL